MDAATKAMQTVADKREALAKKREALETAKVELKQAMVEASTAGVALRPIAVQAGISHETVRRIVRNAG